MESQQESKCKLMPAIQDARKEFQDFCIEQVKNDLPGWSSKDELIVQSDDNITFVGAITSLLWFKSRCYLFFRFNTDRYDLNECVQILYFDDLSNFLTLQDSQNHMSFGAAREKINKFPLQAEKSHQIQKLHENLEQFEAILSQQEKSLEPLIQSNLNNNEIFKEISIKYYLQSETIKDKFQCENFDYTQFQHKDEVIHKIQHKIIITETLQFNCFGIQIEILQFFIVTKKWQTYIIVQNNQTTHSEENTTDKQYNYKDYEHHYTQRLFSLNYYNKDKKYQFHAMKAKKEEIIIMLQLLEQKQLVNVIDIGKLVQDFSSIVPHKLLGASIEQSLELDPLYLQSIFKRGSVLLVDRGLYQHACVYLRHDMIIHINGGALNEKLNMQKEKAKIFNYDRFLHFLHDSTDILQYRLYFQIFNYEELLIRTDKMSSDEYTYNLVDLNCQHLAFQLVTGEKFSTQMNQSIIKNIGANITTAFTSLFK